MMCSYCSYFGSSFWRDLVNFAEDFAELCIFAFQTTSVHALARQLLGSAYSNGVLELNASDSRGIDVSEIFFIFSVIEFSDFRFTIHCLENFLFAVTIGCEE